MKIPEFRTSLYAALALAIACYVSPFGWGATYRPMPIVNFLLSAALYIAILAAGVRTARTWLLTNSRIRWAMVVGSVVLSLILALLGAQSLWIQQTSMHDQWIHHKTSVVMALAVLAVFTLQEFIWKWQQRGAQPCHRAYR